MGKRADGERCLMCELGRDMIDSDDIYQLCDDCAGMVMWVAKGMDE